MAEQRTYLGCSVLDAARARIAWCFDELPRLYVSFSGGKDSTVMLHLVMEEAKRHNRRVGVLFVDLEAQYTLTIEHVARLFEQYAPWIDPYWVCLPLKLRNAVSQFEPRWMCWEPAREADWVPAIVLDVSTQLPACYWFAGGRYWLDDPSFGDVVAFDTLAYSDELGLHRRLP